jgi:hypothetical protein
MLPHEQPFVVANDARDDAEALHALLEQHSYLFFRGLMDADVIRQVRHDVLALCRDVGWLDPNSPLDEGVWSGTVAYVEGEPPYMQVYRQVLKLPSFQQLPHHPVFLDIAEKILGGPVLVHPRQIGRITFPATDKVTAPPPHQDWHFIRGTTQTYTMWLPLGDCPHELGGLAVLAGSHRMAYQPHVPMQGTGGAGVALEEQGEWHTTDYKIGDFVIFHSYTVHQALPNRSGRFLRLSTDNRYQWESDEIDPSSLQPHYNLNLDD